jgi:hypothetical protein
LEKAIPFFFVDRSVPGRQRFEGGHGTDDDPRASPGAKAAELAKFVSPSWPGERARERGGFRP